MTGRYYVKRHDGKIGGPFSADALKTFAREGKLLLSWEISTDQKKWVAAAKVQNLFGGLETALSEHLSSGERYRTLTRQEQIHLFLHHFVFSNEKFKNAFPWLQRLWEWWAKFTLPADGFVITEVTASGVRHVKYDPKDGQAQEIDPQKAEKRVADGVRQPRWVIAVYVLLGLSWGVWAIQGFDFTWSAIKALPFAALALVSFVWNLKHSRVFVGYDLDESVRRHLDEITQAFRVLRRCSQAWMFQVEEKKGKLHWKYNAGDSWSVAKLPVAIFNRPIPNLETNIKVNGITFHNQAVYFLPEKVLIVEGGEVHHLTYQELRITTDHLEYVETEGQVYKDSQQIGTRWKYINRDGSADRRFKDNYQLPVVRCGILCLGGGDARMEIMTTNPDAPEVFQKMLRRARKPLPAPVPPERSFPEEFAEDDEPLKATTKPSDRKRSAPESDLSSIPWAELAEPEAGEGTEDIATKIKKLAELRDKGILSEEEFQKKKAELLSRW
jgi:hypothetical protein